MNSVFSSKVCFLHVISSSSCISRHWSKRDFSVKFIFLLAFYSLHYIHYSTNNTYNYRTEIIADDTESNKTQPLTFKDNYPSEKRETNAIRFKGRKCKAATVRTKKLWVKGQRSPRQGEVTSLVKKRSHPLGSGPVQPYSAAVHLRLIQ